MTATELAGKLDGHTYPLSQGDLPEEAGSSGLVAVWGASDDLAELGGAVEDEVGFYGGGTIHLTSFGLVENQCDNPTCPYHAKELEAAAAIEAKWNETGIAWTYATDIPHETFDVIEDGEVYCRGIVFALADVGVER